MNYNPNNYSNQNNEYTNNQTINPNINQNIQTNNQIEHQIQQQNNNNKNNNTLKIIIAIIGTLVLISTILLICIKPNFKSKNNDLENNNINTEENTDYYELIATQAETYLTENVNKFYKELFKNENEYVVTIDKSSIEYTNKYSSNNDFYYVMEGTAKSKKTGLSVGIHLARCKFNKQTKKITDYGDNSRITIVLKVYEEATKGYFYIPSDQYKNNILWNTDDINKDNFNDALVGIDEIMYFNYEYSYTKNESSFEKLKSNHISSIKKAMKCNKVNVHLVQIITQDELASALKLAEYVASVDLYTGNIDKINEFTNYLKTVGLYYTETIETVN